MDIKDNFPLMYYLNLGRRQDRRIECEEEFERLNLDVVRFPAVDAGWVKNIRNFQFAGRYAHALGLRLMLRSALLKKAPSVFIFEDDVSIDPSLHDALSSMDLPSDWGMFYLGGMHCERPEVIKNHLVRVRGALATHAFGVRRKYFKTIIRALNKMDSIDEFVPAADVVLGRLHESIPTYAYFPNLAGQRQGFSDLAKGSYEPYTKDGQQNWLPECLAGVMAEVLGGHAYEPAKRETSSWRAWFRYGSLPKNFNFKVESDETLTTGITKDYKTTSESVVLIFDNTPIHKEQWEKYRDQPSETVSIFTKNDHNQMSDIEKRLSVLRKLLEKKELGFFIFLPRDCIPLRPFRDLLKLTALDGRSRFVWEPGENRLLDKIPQCYTVTHSRWIMLSREAAELVAKDDFTDCFGNDAQKEWCYEGTVLKMKGYPMDDMVAKQNMVKACPKENDNKNIVAGMLIGEGGFFVDSASQELADKNLHQS